MTYFQGVVLIILGIIIALGIGTIIQHLKIIVANSQHNQIFNNGILNHIADKLEKLIIVVDRLKDR